MRKCIIRKISVVIVPIIVLVILSVWVSLIKFHVWNPITVIDGLIKIKFQNEKLVELKNNPKVILSNPRFDLLLEYMRNIGYDILEEEQLGSMYVFQDSLTNHKYVVFYSINKYYSLWVWD